MVKTQDKAPRISLKSIANSQYQRLQETFRIPFIRFIARIHDKETDAIHSVREIDKRFVQQSLCGTARESPGISIYLRTPRAYPFWIPKASALADSLECLYHLVIRIYVEISSATRTRPTGSPAAFFKATGEHSRSVNAYLPPGAGSYLKMRDSIPLPAEFMKLTA